MSYASRTPAFNHVLAAIPSDDQAYLLPFMRIEHPPQGRVLSSRTDPATSVWFPNAGLVALSVTDDSGRSVQTGLIGAEGCVGLEALFGETSAMPDAFVQIEGEMSAIAVARLRTVLSARPPLNASLLRSAYAISAQASQTIACNRLHSMEARCCRWLLMMQDGALSDDLPVTQEALATMLGSGRPRVNMLLADLERDGILRRYRGRIRLINRRGLERRVCECYHVIRHFAEPSSLRGGESRLSQ